MSETESRHGFVRKSFLRLSWPLIIVTLVTLLAALANVVILSVASPELNAATANANQVFGVLYDISVIFSIGALVVVAQYLGAQKFAAARKASKAALWASAILGIAISVAVLVGGRWVLGLIKTPAEVFEASWTYMWIAGISLAFNAFIVAGTAVLRAYGRTPALLVVGIIINVLDVALLYVLIHIFNLGAAGAALPSLIVRGAGALVLLAMIRNAFKKAPAENIETDASAPVKHHTSVGLAWLEARLSWPTVLELFACNAVVLYSMQWLNAGWGTDGINQRSYALTLTALVTGIMLALAQGNETIVGWDVGAHEAAAAKRTTHRVAIGAAIAAAVLAAVLWYFADAVLSIFGPSPEVVAGAKTALLYSIVLLPLAAITVVMYGALRSAGDVIIPMIYSVLASVAILLPASWFFIDKLQLGVGGVFIALIIMEAVRATLLTARFSRGKWMHRKTVVDHVAADEIATADA